MNDEGLMLGNTGDKKSRNESIIGGRPHFSKQSIDDGKTVKVAAIDPL